ncbi:MAG TPA: cell envelope integrity protein TolA, partial [Candidatus Hydrogenedentes bacterium]|nr:cell envelope integrity protein TolA [Candidatus Hydrogenedentota bacterium]
MSKNTSQIPDDQQYALHPYWREKKAKKWLTRLILFSIILHVAVILLLGLLSKFHFKKPEVEVLMLSGGVTISENAAETPANPEPQPEVKPEPPKPEPPKPEPPKPEPPKPEPPK